MSVANPEGKYLELLFFGISHYWLLPEEKDVLHAWLWLEVVFVFCLGMGTSTPLAVGRAEDW